MSLSRTLYFIILVTSCIFYCIHGYCSESEETEDYYIDNIDENQIRVLSVTTICSHVNLNSGPLDTSDMEGYGCSSCPRILEISHSKIGVIPPSSFINYPKTTKLNIRNSGVESIIPGAFNSLTSLEELYLSSNNITLVSGGVFNSLVKLRTLDLSRNNIQNLGQHSFTGAMNLEVLNLSSNALEYIDSQLLIHMKKIKQVDLSFNKLNIFNFTLMTDEVQNLNLSNNHIKKIYGCFAELTILNLSYNLLTTLENNTCGNSISKILGLDLSHNSLSNLDGISTMHSLKSLSLQNNNINFIPNDFFSKLNELTFLNLSSNELDKFQYGLFDGLSSLITLDVSKNQLTDFENYNYHLLKNLQELYIHDNEINNFDSKKFSELLEQLRVISIDGNDFACSVLVEIFHNLRSIHVPKGHSFNTSNIQGIACSEIDYNSELNSQQNLDVNATVDDTLKTKLVRLFNTDFVKSSMYSYFNKDFKKSNFYKYLENLKLIGNLSINSYEKSLENMKNMQKYQEGFNRIVNNYFNNDFKNSSFVQYLENLKSNGNFLNNGFTKSVMYNYFNKDFVNSNFYKYLEALKKPQFAVKFAEDANDTKVEKLIGTFEGIEEKSDDATLLVIIIVLLVIISCIMLCFMYIGYMKFEKLVGIKNEQVELFET